MKVKETQVTTTFKDKYYLMYKGAYVQVFMALSGITSVSLNKDRDPEYAIDNENLALKLSKFIKGYTLSYDSWRRSDIEFIVNLEDKDQIEIVRIIEENKTTIMK